MTYIYNLVALSALCLLGTQQLQAQSIGLSTLNSSGGTGSSSGTTLDWSFGEMTAVHTASSGSLLVTHGVLQPGESTTSIPLIRMSKEECNVFPNPVEQDLFVHLKLSSNNNVHIIMTDAMGKTVYQNQVNAHSQFSIPMKNYSSGNYFLQISTHDKIQSFSVLKN